MSEAWSRLRMALEELRVLIKELRGRGGLRHGLSYVRVSDIVEQSRCEARLEARLGEESVDKRLRELALLAELALGARRRLPEEPGGAVILSVPLAGVAAGVPIVGRPRGVLFERGEAKVVVYASISSRFARFYRQDRVRAYAYCAALLGSPLPRRNPVYVHVKAVDQEALVKMLDSLSRRMLEGDVPQPLIGENGAVHIIACTEAAVEELEPLLAYWLGLREARRTPGPWCNDCPLRDECRYAPVGSRREGL